MSLKYAFGWYLKQFGRAEKTRTVNIAFWRLTIVGTSEKKWKQCLWSMHCDGMWWNCRKKMKTRTVNGALWRYLKQFKTFMSRLVSAHPHWPSFFYIAFWDILIFWLSRKSTSSQWKLLNFSCHNTFQNRKYSLPYKCIYTCCFTKCIVTLN